MDIVLKDNGKMVIYKKVIYIKMIIGLKVYMI